MELIGVQSSAGSEFKLLSDGSYLAGGKNPDVDKVTITAKTDLREIAGVRLEAFAHDSLSGRGPGRAEHGNFVLSEFRVFAAASSEIKTEDRVPLKYAQADFAQDQFPASSAIDGKEQTGWAVGPQTGRDHWAMFIAQQPIHGDKTPWLQLVLSQNHGTAHLGIPQDIRAILALAAETRSPQQSQALAEYFVAEDSKAKELGEQIKKLQERVAAQPLMKVRTMAQRTANPRTSHLLHRGDFLQPETEVQPAAPAIFPPLNSRNGGTPDRLDLARSDEESSARPTILACEASGPRILNCSIGWPRSSWAEGGAARR